MQYNHSIYTGKWLMIVLNVQMVWEKVLPNPAMGFWQKLSHRLWAGIHIEAVCRNHLPRKKPAQ